MKKKGLIIATIVMVLVLAVSLTTATYAWFTLSTTTSVEPIEFSVGTASDLVIGLKADNIYDAAAKSGDFVFGSTALGEGFHTDNVANGTIPTKGSKYWDGEPGLLNEIDMQLSMDDLQKAVGTGTVYKAPSTQGANDAVPRTAVQLDPAKLREVATTAAQGTVMASGVAGTVSDTTVERAFAQRDYLDVVIGVQASAADLSKIICNITINPSADDINLGMNAAIHVAYRVGGMVESVANTDVYTTNGYGTALETLKHDLVKNYDGSETGMTDTSTLGGPAADSQNKQTLNNGAINIPVVIATADDGYLSVTQIYQIHIIIWIDGTDADCLNSALGVESEIFINFQAVAPDRA